MKKILFNIMFLIILLLANGIYPQDISDINYKWGVNKKLIKNTFSKGELVIENKNSLFYKSTNDENNYNALFIFDDNDKLVCTSIEYENKFKNVFDYLNFCLDIEIQLIENYENIESQFNNERISEFILGAREKIYSSYIDKNSYVVHYFGKGEYAHGIIFYDKDKVFEASLIMNRLLEGE